MLRLTPRLPEALRASAWWLALAGGIVTVGLVTLPWADNYPPEPLATALVWACFLAVSGFLVVLTVRRRQLLRERPSIPLSFLAACLVFSPLSMLLAFAIPELFVFSIYFFFAGVFHVASFVLLALLLAPVAFRSSARYLFLIERIGLFSSLLLLTGSILNGVWMGAVYQRLYSSQDTVVDCYPFIPFGHWVLDQEYGGETGALLNGAELWHLQALWLLFAATAWGLAVFLYRRVAASFLWVDPE